jgi:chromosome segregation ATPase
MDTSAENPDLMKCCSPTERKQKLEEKAAKAQEAFEKEEKARKEIEAAYTKLLNEKNELSASLEGEKGNIADFHEKTNKLKAQKSDLEAQLNVSFILFHIINNILHDYYRIRHFILREK